jgi:NAD(P)-dependent dehydrogenase (short-subunit alcohol dehydrogenase family)
LKATEKNSKLENITMGTLVTGASSGIGREIAITLSSSRSVIIHGRNRTRLEETLKNCSPGNHKIWECDFEQVNEIGESLKNQIMATRQPISEFVHCAGIPSVGSARLLDLNQLQKAMNVNTFSALEIISSLLKKNINQTAIQRVVFISSIWSQFGSIGHSVYSATKGALDSAMRSLAVELAPKVRINSLSLGAIHTPMSANALSDPGIRQHTEANYPLGIGTTESAAKACEFLLSEDSKWITGQVIVVDGGRTSHMSNKILNV